LNFEGQGEIGQSPAFPEGKSVGSIETIAFYAKKYHPLLTIFVNAR